MKRERAARRRTRRSNPRRYAVGEASRERILEAAERILKRKGYHAFTTRRIAQECGISAGNLTYYFPTKNSLIEELMETIYVRYEQRYRSEVRSRKNRDSGSGLLAYVTTFLRDSANPDDTGLFLELWVMARHHQFGAKVINRFYERTMHAIAEAISDERPDVSKRDSMLIAYFLAALGDGIAAMVWHRGDQEVRVDDLIGLANQGIQGLLRHRSDASSGGTRLKELPSSPA